MTISKRGYENNDEHIIEYLIKAPRNSLEEKIKQIEADILSRQNIRDNALTEIFTSIVRLKDRLKRLDYVSVFNESFIVNRDFIKQIIQLEETAINEIIASFKDVLYLRDKLHQAKEELGLENLKLSLLDSDSTKEAGKYPK